MTGNSENKRYPRRQLKAFGHRALEQHGWAVERVRGIGKSSVRTITKGKIRRLISLKTTLDQWFAFARNQDDTGWETLETVDVVVVVTLDDRDNPKSATVHMFDADALRDRFDRAYAARLAAGYAVDKNRGVWISLYHPDEDEPVTHVGGGAGLDETTVLARYSLDGKQVAVVNTSLNDESVAGTAEQPLTIAEAKRRLAAHLGVDPSAIKITVEA